MIGSEAPQKPLPVLADVPERNELRALQSHIEEYRDQIAALDLDIETLRDRLACFEAHYKARLASEHTALQRLQGLLRHMERWSELLRRLSAARLAKRAQRLEARRDKELKEHAPPRSSSGAPRHRSRAQKNEPLERPPAHEPDDDLKASYRELARRYHPDLARTEEERLRTGQIMSRINTLYRAGDLARLRALCEQARGAELEDVEISVGEQLELLRSRRQWFDAVLRNLEDERQALERSATCELMRNVQQAEAMGHDLIAELQQELQANIAERYGDVRVAVTALEDDVNRHNRELRRSDELDPVSRSGGELDRIFDPYADKRMVRLGLEQLATQRLSRAGRELAAWLEKEGPNQLAVLRLVLFAYVSELSPFPLAGLESYDDLALRMGTLAQGDDTPATLEQALVAADDLVEFGVRRGAGELLHTGLRFRSELLREAVPVALRALGVKRVFKEVLRVLGEHVRCSECQDKVFAVPLYRTRGLDDLRASVCPQCGATLHSYWMPKGEDVQAVLNPTFLDQEIIFEWSFRIARGSIAMQLTPGQVESSTVSDLKRRFIADIFTRHELGIERRHVQLHQNGKRVVERTPLEDVENAQFTVRFTRDAPLREEEALELLRHRIRNRFKSG